MQTTKQMTVWLIDNINHFKNDETGATAIEYGMIASMISIGIVAAVTDIGTKLVEKFTTLNDLL